MTKKKVTDLRAETNLLKQAIDTIKTGATHLSTAKLAVIISILALLVTSLISIGAWNDAKEARIRAEYQDQKIEDLDRNVEYLTLLSTTLRAEIQAQGYKLSEPQEK